ncbi:MAG: hypothetical protein M1836_002162 [Candelina mexicana]|nr:MAG: hypothetical protein M1836_002162 [Candelina mexicana]
MPRSAIDATRFTATGPHAHSKSSISSATVPSSSSQPLETPQQKVNRLRNAARKARFDKESKFDKVVARGRVWADRAHRFTTLSLIAATGMILSFLESPLFKMENYPGRRAVVKHRANSYDDTGVATVVAVYGLGGMIIYNRRQRRDFFAQQKALHAKALTIAREAAAQGIADEDQMLLLNRERAAQEAEQARLAKKGIWKRTKEWLYSGLKTEDDGSSSRANLVAVGDEAWKENTSESNDVTGDKLGILKAVKEKRKEGVEPGTVDAPSPAPEPRGGPLDKLANGEPPTAKGGWTSFVTRR